MGNKLRQEDAKYILENYKGVSALKMSNMLYDMAGIRYSKSNIQRFYSINGLKSGLDGRFQKGYKSPGSFQKGFANLNENQIARIKSTQYKKGNIPSTHKEIGTISKRKRSDGFHNDYSWIKIDENKWQLEHVYNWEKEYGKIPQGYKLVHLDGDGYNNELSNLEMVSSGEMLSINRCGLTKDAELNKTIVYTTKLLNKLKD